MSFGRFGQVPTRTLVVVVLSVLLSATLSGAPQIPGEKLESKPLQSDILDLVLRMDGATAPECRQRTIVKTEVIRPATLSSSLEGAKPAGPWQERWYVDRCGEVVAWDVRYTPSAGGGTDIDVGLAAEGGSGDTANEPDLESPTVPPARSPRPTFLVTSANDGGPGSLAQAILDANASPNQDGPDLILFKIPDPGLHAITLTAALPEITDPVEIDGYSQPGAVPNTLPDGSNAVLMVQLDGSGLSRPTHGLLLRAGSSTVRGLRIHGFDGDGIRIEDGGYNRIEGNLLGGGPGEARGIGNSGSGVAVVDSSNNVIGGSVPSARNVIEGNGEAGVRISGDSAIGNAILCNVITRNTGDGIDLVSDSAGVPYEPGHGPNKLQQPPLLTSVSYSPAGAGRKAEVVVEGVLEGDAAATYHIELFATRPRSSVGPVEKVPEARPSPEGERFLGSMEVVAGEDGRAGFQFHLPRGVHSRDNVTATATDPDGNTSEFSQPAAAPTFTIVWNTGTGNWGTAGNWNPPQVPGSGDDVLIAENGVNSTFTVTVNVAATVNSLTLGGGSGTQTLSIASQTLTLNSASTVNANGILSHSGGTIGGAGALTVDGTLNWSAGSGSTTLMTGTGVTTVNGPLNLSGVGLKQLTLGRTLNNTGTATWVAGEVRAGTGTAINNTGTWNAQIDSLIQGVFNGGAGTFTNSGAFTKAAGSGTTAVSLPFTNSGTVDVRTGTISFGAGGSSTGGFSNSAPSVTLQFAGGTFDLNAGTSFTGIGTLLVSGGTLNVNSTISTPAPGTVQVSGGTMNVNSAISTAAVTAFTMTGGTLGGTGTLTIDGNCDWSGGEMTGAGVTTVNGPLNVSGVTVRQLTGTRTLNNTGTATWISGQIRAGTGTAINNTGTWDTRSDSQIQGVFNGGVGTLTNSGTLLKSAGSGATTVSIPFINSGLVNVQSGTVNFNAGGSGTGSFTASTAAAALQFGGGTFNLNAGSTLAGPGTVLLSLGTLNVNDVISTPAETQFTMTGGTLGGTGTLTIAGTMNWSAGSGATTLMTGTGVTTVNGPLNLIGVGVKQLTGGRTLNNMGTATWISGEVRPGTGTVINNTGTWDAEIDSLIQPVFNGGAGTFTNSGTFVKSVGSGTTTVSVPFANNGTVDVRTGTLNVGGSNYTQTAGITSLTGGALTSSTNINIMGGALEGSGTVTGPVVVSGTGALAPGFSPGTLSVAGNYTQQGPAGAFNVEIGGTAPGSQFDRVDVSGTGRVATLGGTLNVSLINSFTPAIGDSFTIMTYPSHTGTFTPNMPLAGCLGWNVTYGSTSVVLTTVDAPVEVTGLAFLPNQVGLVWDSAPISSGTVYDVLRGDLGHLPVGLGPGELCLDPGITATTATDTDTPAVGHGFWYVVRERLDDLGAGTYGHASNGTERMSTTCPGAVNQTATSNAGPDQTVSAGATVQLDGSQSFDPEGAQLSYLWSLTTVPSGSSAVISSTSVVNPTFVADKVGTYTAQLAVGDGCRISAPDIVMITATNRQPIALDDAATTTQDTPVTIPVLANDNDPDLDPLTVTGVTQPANGEAVANLDNTVTYTPASGFAGSDSFTYSISDGQGGTASATVGVTVNCQAPPTITSVSPLSGPVGTEVTITGTDLDCGSTRNLTLNGVQAIITFLSRTTIKTFIPISAQDGLFSYTTDRGTATAPPEFAFDVITSSDFSLTIAPTDGKVIQGSSSSYSVQIDSVGGQPFTGLAQLEVTGLPTGVDATFSPSTLTGGQRGMLTVTAAPDAPLGSEQLTLSAMATIDAQSVSKTMNFDLTVLQGNRTALLGQFLLSNGPPMPGVILKLISHVDGSELAETTTDAGGNFLFLDPPAGVLTLSVNTTPFDPTRPFPIYGIDVTVMAGQATVVGPFKVSEPPPASAFVPIDNATQDQIVTNPNFPGVSITLPAGATVTGWDGVVKNKIAIIKLSPDALPMPPPPGPTRSLYQFNFGTSTGGIPSVPLPITLPNDQGADPGEKADIWYYDAAPLVGAQGIWRLAGSGTVSQDGRVLVSDPGVGIERFCGVCGTPCMILRQLAQKIRNLFSKLAGDPIDLFLGEQIEEKTDLVLAGRIPAVIHRTYNPEDPFAIKGLTLGLGPGWALSVDIVLLQASPMLQRVVLPGNARSDFAQQGVGSFVNADNPLFAGAVLTADSGNRFHLRFKNGSVWRFIPHPNPQLVGTSLLSEQIDRNGNVLTIERNNAGSITRLIEPAGRALTFTYSGNRISQVTDPIGRTVGFGYISGRLRTVTDPAGGVTTYSYDSAGRILTITDPRNIAYVTNEYNSEGRVVRQTLADGGSWTMEYLRPAGATTGAITGARVTDPRGNSTTHRFSATGFTIETVDALGQSTKFDRDSRGQVLSVTDPLARMTTFEYDGGGNITKSIDPAGNIRVFEYEPTFNKPTRVIDPLGNVTTLEYDAQGNLITMTDPEQNLRPAADRLSSTIAYNPFGQPVSTTDVLGNVTSFAYDSSGSLASIKDSLGNSTRRSYDGVSRLISEADPRGATTSIAYDVLNRITQIADAAGGLTGFSYDPNGNVLMVTDAHGNSVTHTYDVMDHLAVRSDRLNHPEVFHYDLNGHVDQHTDRKGQVSTFRYDELSRLIETTHADGASSRFQYDAVGRLVRAQNSDGEELFRYDLLGNPIVSNSPWGTIQYTYDKAGRRTAMYATGEPPVSYTYDANSRVRELAAGSAVVTIDYDALNRRTRVVLPNGVSTEYVYAAASHISELIYRHSSETLGNLTYQYDSSGNRIGLGGSFAQTLLPERVASSSYDANNRQLVFGDKSMSYDLSGNLLAIVSPSDSTTYTWDAGGALRTVNGRSVAASFSYDVVGRRTTKQLDGHLSQFLYDGLDQILERSDTDTTSYTAQVRIDEPFQRNNVEFYLSDAIGSIVALTDESGQVRTRYSYEPFGAVNVQGAASTNTIQFTGRENDGGGLYYYRARYYNPLLHRFVSEDPIGFQAGSTNYYAYAANNPVTTNDPLGLILPGYESMVFDNRPDLPPLLTLATMGAETAGLVQGFRDTAIDLRYVTPWSVNAWLQEENITGKVGFALGFAETAAYASQGQYARALYEATKAVTLIPFDLLADEIGCVGLCQQYVDWYLGNGFEAATDVLGYAGFRIWDAYESKSLGRR